MERTGAVLEALLEAAAEAVGATRAALCWREAHGELRPLALLGMTAEVAVACARPLLEARGAPLGREAWRAGVGQQLGCAELAVSPLGVAEGEGVLLACLPGGPGPWEPVARRLELYARLVGMALERERLEEASRLAAVQARAEAEQAELLRLTGFQSVMEGVSGALSCEEVGRAVLERGLPVVGASCGTLYLVGAQGLERVAAAGLGDKALERWEVAGHGRPPGLEVLLSGTPLWLGGAEEVRASCPGLLALGEGAACEACALLPLQVEQRTVGVLSFGFGRPRRFTELRRALLRGLARQCAQALGRARLYEKERAARLQAEAAGQRLRLLVEVGLLLAEAGLDLRAVLDVVGRRVAGVLGEGCVIQLLSEEGAWLEPVVLHHPEPAARELLAKVVHARPQRAGEGLHGQVVASGQSALLPAVEAAGLGRTALPSEYLPYVERFGPQSLLVVPLAVGGRVFGTLGLLRAVGERAYGGEDLLLLESLAERAARAIEDARLFGAATEAVRLRDDFLSVAGHELKTPLSALRLQIQLLARMTREAVGTPGLVERVAKAERISERLGALIDELLDVGRISSGRLRLERSEVELGALVREVVGRQWEELLRAGCEVRVEVEGPLEGRVVGQWDRLRLEQVVGNLLSNAAKYGRGLPVQVRVEAGGGLARLVVRDQGIGIALGDQARIFERFERLVGGRQYPGLGLGLWITRQIVEAHEGHILVESEPGQGSTFTVELPL